MCSLSKLNLDEDTVWTETEKKVKMMKVIVYIKQYHDLTCVLEPGPITEYCTQFVKILKRKLVY